MASSKQNASKEKVGYNGWMLVRDVFKGVFSLLNGGKIYPAFGLLLVILIGVAEWRLPSDQIAPILKEILLTVRSSFFLMLFVAVVTNICWSWLFLKQKKMYQEEILRLAEIRRQLVHREDKNELTPIACHRSSEFVDNKTHIFPSGSLGDKK